MHPHHSRSLAPSPASNLSHEVRQPFFSIVTVCRNAEAPLRRTIPTLAAQSFHDYEWLIIDGASCDRSLELVHKASVVAKRVVSEPDSGIYDAMNKAIGLAKGRWIYFLNAGDQLASPTVLQQVFALVTKGDSTDLVWGDVMYVRADTHLLHRFAHVRPALLPFEDLNHQAVFARPSLFEEFGSFDLRYRLCADYEWLLRVLRGGATYRYLPLCIANFEADGAHARNVPLLRLEQRQIRRRHASRFALFIGALVARIRRSLRFRGTRWTSSRSPSPFDAHRNIPS